MMLFVPSGGISAPNNGPTNSEPIQVTSTIGNGHNNIDLYEVPEGYRLIIEYVSYHLIIFGGDAWDSVLNMAWFNTETGGVSCDHSINIMPVMNHYNGTAVQGGQVTKIYADSQSIVKVFFVVYPGGGRGPSWRGNITISGLLVPSD